MTKNLTIIIVTFNSSEVIENCLSKLNVKKYDVIVVDNASTDNTVEIVLKNFSDVKIIKSPKNIGYGRANNIALRQIKTEFSLILNPDAFIFEEDIQKVLEIMKEDEKITLASPKVFCNEELAGDFLITKKEYQDSKFIIGGVLFIKMQNLKQIGFFDESFFMFAEDNELSDRTLENGFKNVIINSAKAFHIGAGSSKKSLRNTYRRFWHLGWSKSKYKQKRKNKFNSIRATSRLVIAYFFEAIFYLLTGKIEKSVGKIAFSLGCFSFLIGLKAFKKDGTARG